MPRGRLARSPAGKSESVASAQRGGGDEAGSWARTVSGLRVARALASGVRRAEGGGDAVASERAEQGPAGPSGDLGRACEGEGAWAGRAGALGQGEGGWIGLQGFGCWVGSSLFSFFFLPLFYL